MKNNQIKAIVICLVLLGVITIFAGGSVLLDLFDMRKREGNYVPFVVWTNFACGFIYLVAAYGIQRKQRWAAHLLFLAFALLLLVFVELIFHIQRGGLYEVKTIYAMSFRTAATLVFALLSYTLLKKNKNNNSGEG